MTKTARSTQSLRAQGDGGRKRSGATLLKGYITRSSFLEGKWSSGKWISCPFRGAGFSKALSLYSSTTQYPPQKLQLHLRMRRSGEVLRGSMSNCSLECQAA